MNDCIEFILKYYPVIGFFILFFIAIPMTISNIKIMPLCLDDNINPRPYLPIFLTILFMQSCVVLEVTIKGSIW